MSIFENIEVEIKVELGATTMPIHHLLRLGRGAVIELDSSEHDLMRIYANNQHIANGEIRIDEGQLTVQVAEKVQSNP